MQNLKGWCVGGPSRFPKRISSCIIGNCKHSKCPVNPRCMRKGTVVNYTVHCIVTVLFGLASKFQICNIQTSYNAIAPRILHYSACSFIKLINALEMLASGYCLDIWLCRLQWFHFTSPPHGKFKLDHSFCRATFAFLHLITSVAIVIKKVGRHSFVQKEL